MLITTETADRPTTVRNHPYTIDNGAGERLTFLGLRDDVLEVANSVDPGAGPPMHVHHLQEEGLTVQRGRIGYQRQGEPSQTAGPGETVVFAPGEVHRFWNAGTDELACTGWITPAGNLEWFLARLFASIQANGGKRPRVYDTAFLCTLYRDEFGIADIPAPVQRLAFPVVLALGNLLGLHARFADAPAPERAARR